MHFPTVQLILCSHLKYCIDSSTGKALNPSWLRMNEFMDSSKRLHFPTFFQLYFRHFLFKKIRSSQKKKESQTLLPLFNNWHKCLATFPRQILLSKHICYVSFRGVNNDSWWKLVEPLQNRCLDSGSGLWIHRLYIVNVNTGALYR